MKIKKAYEVSLLLRQIYRFSHLLHEIFINTTKTWMLTTGR